MTNSKHLALILDLIRDLDPGSRVELLKEFAEVLGYRIVKKLKEND